MKRAQLPTDATRSRRFGSQMMLVLAILLAGLLGLRLIGLMTATTPGNTTVMGYIGDSLTADQGEAAIATDLSSLGFSSANLKVSGLDGRSISGQFPTPGSTDVVNTWRTADNFHPNVWLIALSSNDVNGSKAEIKARIATLLAVLDDEPVNRVLWVGPVARPGSSMQAAVDTNVISALTGTVGEKAGVIDFRFFDIQTALRALGLNEESPALWIDDWHMTARGSDLRMSLIHDFIAADLPAASSTITTPGSGQPRMVPLHPKLGHPGRRGPDGQQS